MLRIDPSPPAEQFQAHRPPLRAVAYRAAFRTGANLTPEHAAGPGKTSWLNG